MGIALNIAEFVYLAPFAFGLFLMALFLIYCVLFAWLALFPIFSWHFRFMSKVWYLGLAIVARTWKAGLIGIVIAFVASLFI